VTGERVLIVGGGFAGTYAALEMERLADAGHTVTLVSAENFMQYQPFLPEVASGTIDPRAIVVPLRSVLKRLNVNVGEVTAIDHDARRAQVRIGDGSSVTLDYDILVLTAGSWSRVLPIPGLAEHGVGFKTVQEAIYLRNHVLSRLDVASETADPERRRAALTFVFVGAGFAGVEALGELEDLARDASRSYRTLDVSEMRWILVEAAGRILPELALDLAEYAQARLRERGVEVLLETRLGSAEGGTIRLSDGQAFSADTLVWTAGVKPSPLALTSGLPLDDHGRVIVDRYLRVAGVPDAWAAGDLAAVPDLTTGGLAPGPALGPQHRGLTFRRRHPPVRVAQRRRRVLARSLQGGGERVRREGEGLRRMVPASLVPPVGDADARPADPHSARLDNRAALPTRHLADGLVPGSPRAVPPRRPGIAWARRPCDAASAVRSRPAKLCGSARCPASRDRRRAPRPPIS